MKVTSSLLIWTLVDPRRGTYPSPQTNTRSRYSNKTHTTLLIGLRRICHRLECINHSTSFSVLKHDIAWGTVPPPDPLLHIPITLVHPLAKPWTHTRQYYDWLAPYYIFFFFTPPFVCTAINYGQRLTLLNSKLILLIISLKKHHIIILMS